VPYWHFMKIPSREIAKFSELDISAIPLTPVFQSTIVATVRGHQMMSGFLSAANLWIKN
jgi:hypothetical protein